MAFPYIFEANFNAGDSSEFASTETDVTGYLNQRSYINLAGRKMPVPYRGAYAAEIDFGTKGTSTNPAYYHETTAFDLTAPASAVYLKFYFYAASDPAWTMATTNRFSIFQLNSAAACEFVTDILYTTAAGYQIVGAQNVTGTDRSCTLEFDKWHCVEAAITINAGAGTLDFYVDGNQIGSQVTTLTNATTTYALYGCTGPDAGTTSGRYYLGPIYLDDTNRIYPDQERFPFNRLISKTQQIFVGPGHIDSATLLTTGASNDLKLYDTDLGSTAVPEDSYKVNLSISTHTSVDDPIRFDRGCYAVLAGTSPRAQIVMTQGSDVPGVIGPIYYSDRGIRLWATKR